MRTEKAFVSKTFRKARDYERVLRGGADAFTNDTMHRAVKDIKKNTRYASHRRPRPSEYEEQ